MLTWTLAVVCGALQPLRSFDAPGNPGQDGVGQVHQLQRHQMPSKRPDDKSIDLAARWQEGDQEAAEELFGRYAAPLIGLVRKHLSEKLAHRFDPEDVVQSAYRSFFTGVRDGRFLLERSGDLWRLLVVIAIHKLRHQVERHTAGKRSVDLESPQDPALFHTSDWGGRQPTPADALVLAEQIEQIVSALTPLDRRMFELRLEGYTLDQIATETHRSQRTVRRVMDRIKRIATRFYQEGLA